MAAPNLPNLQPASSPWGPPAEVPEALRFNEVPYAPFSKGDKLGKVADWNVDGKDGKDQKRQQYGRGFRDPYHAYGASAASFFTMEDAENVSSFEVVDSAAKTAPRPRGAQNAVLRARGGGRGGASSQQGQRGGAGAASAGGRQQQGGRPQDRWGGRGGGGFRRSGWRDWDKPQKNREPSVAIGSNWELVQRIGFNELAKLSFESRQGEDLAAYGEVFYYNRAFDKQPVNVKLEAVDRAIYNPSASDDPVIRDLADKVQASSTYYSTDSVIALLMTAPKTNNPWDIIITKSNGKVFLDKRDGGPLDFLSVDENSYDAPQDATEKESINSAQSLAIEATYINDNFVVDATDENPSKKYEFGKPNPFHDASSGEVPLARGYKYRKFNLANNPEEDEEIPLVIRTEIDAAQHNPTTGKDDLVAIKALNEYGGTSGVLEWKNKIVNQRGAIIATEVKNNLSKVSRWTIQSILSGANLLKIGFVSRVTPKDNTQHNILGVYTQSPAQFAVQVGVNVTNGWGILKSIINICSELGDGKYVLIRDPNAPAVKLFKVPDNAFTEEAE